MYKEAGSTKKLAEGRWRTARAASEFPRASQRGISTICFGVMIWAIVVTAVYLCLIVSQTWFCSLCSYEMYYILPIYALYAEIQS